MLMAIKWWSAAMYTICLSVIIISLITLTEGSSCAFHGLTLLPKLSEPYTAGRFIYSFLDLQFGHNFA